MSDGRTLGGNPGTLGPPDSPFKAAKFGCRVRTPNGTLARNVEAYALNSLGDRT